MKDSRGINRGKCKKCTNCAEYSAPKDGLKCAICNCPPGSHQNLDGGLVVAGLSQQVHQVTLSPDTTQQAWTGASDGTSGMQSFSQTQDMDCSQQLVSFPSLATVCSVPGCTQAVGFDINTGTEHLYCKDHRKVVGSHPMFQTSAGLQVQDIELSDNPYTTMYAQQQMLSAFSQQALQTMDVQTAQMMGLNTSQMGPFITDGYVSSDQMSVTPQTVPNQAGLPQSTMLPSGAKKCAIQECNNPCHVDDSGTVHECCGYTHAMEHQRRQALWQQVNQQVVKGVTHCLLPECSRPCWPFHNYCGRSHADIGKQRGLISPSLSAYSAQPAASSGPKDSTMCIIPECNRKKYVDTKTGATHDYCGKTHAQEGARRGIRPTSDKTEEQCDLPGCTNKKKTEGTRVHDYCCLDHAQKDAPNRDARILTDHNQVQAFLKQFKNLKVVSLDENIHAKPGGVLFNRFKKAYEALPKAQRQTCLAFHGTPSSNIDSICKNGYDRGKRGTGTGQAYGAGEYFGTTPDTSKSYCKTGKKMLLNELLLGQSGTHHTKHSNIIVMKNPDHDLPRYVITFS